MQRNNIKNVLSGTCTPKGSRIKNDMHIYIYIYMCMYVWWLLSVVLSAAVKFYKCSVEEATGKSRTHHR